VVAAVVGRAVTEPQLPLVTEVVAVVVVLVSVAMVVVALAPRAGGKPSISRSKSGHFVSHIISFSIFFLLLLTAGHAKTPSLRLSFFSFILASIDSVSKTDNTRITRLRPRLV
jgi:hypothetical protein